MQKNTRPRSQSVSPVKTICETEKQNENTECPSTSSTAASTSSTAPTFNKASPLASSSSASQPSTSFEWPISSKKKKSDHVSKNFTTQYKMTHFTTRPMPVNVSKEIDHQIVKMVAADYLPFSLVENPAFKTFVKMLSASYSLPSRKTLSKVLLTQVYNKLVEAVKNDLKEATSVTITTDGWTSMSNDNYLALTAHFITKNCQMQSFLLDCFQYNERHTAVNLSEETKRVLMEWDIYDKVNALVTDNAANMSATARLGGWKHLSCFAHSINLVVQAGLKDVNETHVRAKSIVEFFKRSPQASAKLRSIENQMGCEELNVKQDMPIRWNSTYEMFERLIKIKEPIISTLAIVNYSKQTLTSDDWNVIEYCCKIWKVFYEVTIDVSAEKSVTISKIIYLSKALLRHCRSFQDEVDTPPTVINMISKINEQLNRRFLNIEDNAIIAEATFLDPRFKKHGFSSNQAFEKVKTSLTHAASHVTLFTDSISETESNLEVNSTEDVLGQETGSPSIWDEYDKHTANLFQNENNATAASIIEINRYLQEPIIKRNENPLLWWKERAITYPRLYQLTKKRLCVPATSVPCERTFSRAGLTISERRTRLSANKVQKLLFINANHHSILS